MGEHSTVYQEIISLIKQRARQVREEPSLLDYLEQQQQGKKKRSKKTKKIIMRQNMSGLHSIILYSLVGGDRNNPVINI